MLLATGSCMLYIATLLVGCDSDLLPPRFEVDERQADQTLALLLWVALIVLLVSATMTQVVLEGRLQRPAVMPGVHWIQSPGLMRRLAVGFNAIWADIYWIRAVQYYGGTKLSVDEKKNYDQLYPLLDITTSLDPHFNIAYRFGSILLSEGYPNGPGQTEQAIMLLQKGMREMPDKWQYLPRRRLRRVLVAPRLSGGGRLVHQRLEAAWRARTGWSRLRQACWPSTVSAMPRARCGFSWPKDRRARSGCAQAARARAHAARRRGAHRDPRGAGAEVLRHERAISDDAGRS